jgi:hypothetical protein
MRLSAELLRLAELFRMEGLTVRPLKGPLLAQEAYGNVTLRQYGDLDLFVKVSELPRVLSLLEREGYRPEINPDSAGGGLFDRLNVLGMHHDDAGIRLEIHWRPFAKSHGISWNGASLLEGEHQIVIDGRELPAPPPTAHLLYLCLHGAKHCFERLEWVCDIDRMVRSRIDLIDWERLEAEAVEAGVRRMVHLALSLAGEYFETPFPERVRERIARDPTLPELRKRIYALQAERLTPESGWERFSLLWSMREGAGDKIRFLFAALFAPKLEDFTAYPLPPSLAPLYPLLRPFRLLGKYFGKSPDLR